MLDTVGIPKAIQLNMIHLQYHDFLQRICKADAQGIPPHRPIDQTIPLLKGKQPPFGTLYGMSALELTTLREYLEEYLGKGISRSFSSPAGAHILFPNKKDSTLRLFVDYRGLNVVTIMNRYPLPFIDDPLDRLQGARICTQRDLRGAYNVLGIQEGEEWKTAFQTRDGLSADLVMPLSLTNATPNL